MNEFRRQFLQTMDQLYSMLMAEAFARYFEMDELALLISQGGSSLLAAHRATITINGYRRLDWFQATAR
jgi:hypothetical protein